MENKRNYGIDIARLLAMFMVILLHNLSNGGILQFNNTSLSNMEFWFVENLAIVAVNLFALITGFLMIGHEPKIKRLKSLWYEVWFWSVIITLLVSFMTQKFSLPVFIKSLFPVLFKQYWYFNAYIVLYLLMPFLNLGINHLTYVKTLNLIKVLVVLSITVGFVGNLFEENGYSALWLIILYLIGALIGKTKKEKRERVDKNVFLTIYFLGAILSLIGEFISIKYVGHTGHWLSYNSPLILIQSISLFIYLIQVKVNNFYLTKMLKWASPLSFAVYLIDTNPSLFRLFHRRLLFIANYNFGIGLLLLIIISIITFILFLFLDFIRVIIFHWFSELKIKKS